MFTVKVKDHMFNKHEDSVKIKGHLFNKHEDSLCLHCQMVSRCVHTLTPIFFEKADKMMKNGIKEKNLKNCAHYKLKSLL